jgi:putative membrane-bound dehydrogenase-like protein
MHRPRLLLFLPLSIALLASAARGQHIAPTNALTPAEQRKKFKLPPGFEIQLVASEPDIGQPMNLNFDSAGRLWVTHSVEYPFPVEGKGVEPRTRFAGVGKHPPRDRLTIFSDIGPDGRARKVVHFVGGLNIPIGQTPIPHGALVYSIPGIYRCLDTDGDGKADKRELLYGTFGNVDTHGMSNSYTRWIDGWIYGLHGFANTSHVKDGSGRVTTMRSGNSYRFKEDGSRFEHWTWGQTNPFGLTFDPLGNLYSADCHSQPLYQLLRGASYPGLGPERRDDSLPFGPQMIFHDHGSTGICGPAFYAADQFPPGFRNCFYLCNPVTGRVHHDNIKVVGSTVLADTQPDFIRCDDPWFRPVDAKVGPDGALYIADFYNAIIGHYEVPLAHPKRDRDHGRIWRVVYTGDSARLSRKRPLLPDLTNLNAEQLVDKLKDSNLVVRTLATNELFDRFGRRAIGPVRAMLSNSKSPEQRAHGLWVLARLGELDAATVKTLAADKHRLVRVHLLRALAERQTWDDATSALAVAALKDGDAFVRRVAADALGRHPRKENVVPLLTAWNATSAGDTHLVLTLRIALHDHLRIAEIADEVGRTIRPGHPLYPRLIDVHRTVNNARSATALFAELKRSKPNAGPLQRDLYHVARFVKDDALQGVIAWAGARQPRWNDAQTVAAVAALQRALPERGRSLPRNSREAFGRRLTTIVAAKRLPLRARERAVALLGELRSTQAVDTLLRLSGNNANPVSLRRKALESSAAVDADRTLPVLRTIVKRPGAKPELWNAAIQVLGRMNQKAARDELLAVLVTAPFELAKPVARALAGTRNGAAALLETIEKGKASRHLLREPAIVFGLRVARVPNVRKRIEKLTAGLPTIDAQTEQLRRQRKAAFLRGHFSAELGQKVFAKTCAACHRVAGKGGKVGPDLDGIGLRGIDRVLEDVLIPSRNVDPAFRQSTIVTADGRIHTGLVTKEEGKLVVLVNSEGKEERIPADSIEQRKLSSLSAMPADVAAKVKEPDFHHLLAYLLSLSKKP